MMISDTRNPAPPMVASAVSWPLRRPSRTKSPTPRAGMPKVNRYVQTASAETAAIDRGPGTRYRFKIAY